MATPTEPEDDDHRRRPLVYGSHNIKLSVIGEKVFGLQGHDRACPVRTFDDRITFQLQAKF
jgi:hypothetical protein